MVEASCKRNDELKDVNASNIAHLLAIGELESERGLNQIGSLKIAGDTRWSSLYRSLSSLIKMFSATCEVLLNIAENETTYNQRGDADAEYEMITFEFVIILHIMKKLPEISNLVCESFQVESHDILNAMHLVSSTKLLIQNFRDDGWDTLVANVKSFCERVSIHVPDFDARHIGRKGKARHQQDNFTVGQHYKVDIFYAAIDSQLQELNIKFNEHTVELLVLSATLDPKEMHITFRIDDICKLVQNFYPGDFAENEMLQLRSQFEYFDHVRQLPDFGTLETISDLCQWMVKNRKSEIYPLVFRVVTLILTLPVSTATSERSFSSMNTVKTTLRNSMGDQFLTDALILFIEKEIAKQLILILL